MKSVIKRTLNKSRLDSISIAKRSKHSDRQISWRNFAMKYDDIHVYIKFAKDDICCMIVVALGREEKISNVSARLGPKTRLDAEEGFGREEESFPKTSAAFGRSAKVKVHLMRPRGRAPRARERERTRRRPHERFMPTRKTARGAARHLR